MSAFLGGTQSLSPTVALDTSQAHRRLLYIFTYLAALTAVQILHLAMDDLVLNLGFSGGLTAGFVYSYFLEPRFRALTIYIGSAVFLGCSVYYYILIQNEQPMYGNYLGILLGIGMVLLSFKAFSPGDFRFILIPSTICVMFSSVASYDLKFMLLLPLFLVFAGNALYISNQIEVAVRVAGTTGSEANLRYAIHGSFFWELLRAVLGIIVLSSAVYVSVPHSSQASRNLILNSAERVDDTQQSPKSVTPQHTSPDQGGQAEIGLGDNFDLASPGELTGNPAPVLRVKASRNGYLRSQVYDVYTGSGWVQSDWLAPRPGRTGTLIAPGAFPSPFSPHPEIINSYSIPLVDYPSLRYQQTLQHLYQIDVSEGNVYSTNDTADLKYEISRQEITLLQNQPAFYFALFQPFRMENISLGRNDQPLDQPLLDMASCLRPLDVARTHPQGFSYTVYSISPKAGPAKLKQVYVSGPPQITKRYTQLPLAAVPDDNYLKQLGITREQYRPISPRLRNFAGTLVLGHASNNDEPLSIWDKVQSIYNLLSSGKEFTYSRQYKPLNPQLEVTEAFVLGTREGYCRYFASAMAVLCRLNGIPARVVTGYAPGTFSIVDNAYIVKASNAHAWVEVYFDEYGWITFDPTPASQDVFTRGAVSERITSVIDFLQELFVLDPAGTQKNIIAALVAAYDAIRRHWQVATLTVLLFVLATAAWWGIRLLPAKRQQVRIVPENRVVEIFIALLAEFARLGLPLEPATTPRQWVRGIAARYAALAQPLLDFVTTYERAAFSLEPVTAGELSLAEQTLGTVTAFTQQELAARKSHK